MEDNNARPAEKRIDIESVIKEKNPYLAKVLPGFILRYLKRIIHQDEINDFLQKAGDKMGLDFVDEALKVFQPQISLVGLENLTISNRIVVASNHPLGGLDGLALMQAIGRVRKDIQFPVNDILLYIDNLKPLFVPINKHGSNAENIRIFNDTFLGEAVVSYFPFGLVSRKNKGIIRDLDWKKTFLSKAKKFHRDIVPTHISGRNSDFFYKLSNFRKMVGIKANIEMLYLVDEFYQQKNQHLKITFGKPIPWQLFDRRNNDVVWAEKMRGFVYFLENNPEAVFDPEKDYIKMLNKL
jgi:putative hemolysin